MTTVEEFAEDIRTAPVTGGQDVDLSRPLAHHLIKAGYRKVFDGDCGRTYPEPLVEECKTCTSPAELNRAVS